MPVIRIASFDDPRVKPFRDVKGQNQLRGGDYFLVEGKRTVQRLLDSRFEIAAILVTETRLPEWESVVPMEVPLYVVPDDVGSQLVGFAFHIGVMGCGWRQPTSRLEELVLAESLSAGDRRTLVICPHAENPENLGTIIRLCAGFGADGLLLGKGSCDPFSRRVLRVSMGAAFNVPIREARDWLADLRRLRDEWGYELIAVELHDAAVPLSACPRSDRVALIFGNEAHGLSEAMMAECQRRVMIPMAAGADSLNVAISAGIVLHHFTRVV